MGVITHVCCGISARLAYIGSAMKPSKLYICVASGTTTGVSLGSGEFDMLHPHLSDADIFMHVSVELALEDPQPDIDEQVHSLFLAGAYSHAERIVPAKRLLANANNIMQIVNLCRRLLLTGLVLQSEFQNPIFDFMSLSSVRRVRVIRKLVSCFIRRTISEKDSIIF